MTENECVNGKAESCSCIFKVITLVGSNQGNYFENATAHAENDGRNAALELTYWFF